MQKGDSFFVEQQRYNRCTHEGSLTLTLTDKHRRVSAVTEYLQHRRKRIKVASNLKCVSLDRTRNSTQWKYCHGTLPRTHTRQLSATKRYIRDGRRQVGRCGAAACLRLCFIQCQLFSAQQSTTWVRLDQLICVYLWLHFSFVNRWNLPSVSSIGALRRSGGYICTRSTDEVYFNPVLDLKISVAVLKLPRKKSTTSGCYRIKV